jgi:pimeloyl-ACP methyl ester carboxylesterase
MELTVDGKRVYAYTGGKRFDPNLPCIVFVHGGELDHCVWALQSRYLAHHGYGVLALDLPGHGRSDGPLLASIESIADWIPGVLDAAGVAKAQLVGHSMGSLATLECAARHPGRVSGIALLAPAFPMRVSPELLEATRSDEPRAHDMINVWSHSAFAHYPSNPGPGFWVIGENLRLMQRQRPGVLYADFAACNNYTGGLAAAAKVRCPALFILARRDQMTPRRAAQDLIKAINGARVVEIEGSGHALMAEKPDEVLDALRAFLAQAREAA